MARPGWRATSPVSFAGALADLAVGSRSLHREGVSFTVVT